MVDPSAPVASAAAGPATVPPLRRTIVYIEEHRVFIGVLFYLYATLIGLLYFLALYWVTGINLFNFFELTDFLLAGLRHPVLLLLPIIFSLGLGIYHYGFMQVFIPFLEWVEKKTSSSTTIPQTHSESRKSNLYFTLALIVALALVFLPFIPLFTIENIHTCAPPFASISARIRLASSKQTNRC
jgi:hypothetical protein